MFEDVIEILPTSVLSVEGNEWAIQKASSFFFEHDDQDSDSIRRYISCPCKKTRCKFLLDLSVL